MLNRSTKRSAAKMAGRTDGALGISVVDEFSRLNKVELGSGQL